jgi:hypothetical protein
MADTTAATPMITPRHARIERNRLACRLRPAIKHIRRKNIADSRRVLKKEPTALHHGSVSNALAPLSVHHVCPADSILPSTACIDDPLRLHRHVHLVRHQMTVTPGLCRCGRSP